VGLPKGGDPPGPLADVIPSTDELEMYPIGLTSIAADLEANRY
jgi:hypothetical protein